MSLRTMYSERLRELRLARETPDPTVANATSVEVVLSIVSGEAALRRRRFVVAVGTGTIAFMVSSQILHALLPSHPNVASYMTGTLGGGIGFATLVSKRHREATAKAADFNDVRAIGPLLQALYSTDFGIRRSAMVGLEQLLPQIRESDSAMLTDYQRLLLRRSICRKFWGVKSETYVLAALKALEQIGCTEDADYVEVLLCRPDPVRTAAAACLELLRYRERTALGHSQLLRPAMAVALDTNVLVRPAGAGAGADTALLVRVEELKATEEA